MRGNCLSSPLLSSPAKAYSGPSLHVEQSAQAAFCSSHDDMLEPSSRWKSLHAPPPSYSSKLNKIPWRLEIVASVVVVPPWALSTELSAHLLAYQQLPSCIGGQSSDNWAVALGGMFSSLCPCAEQRWQLQPLSANASRLTTQVSAACPFSNSFPGMQGACISPQRDGPKCQCCCCKAEHWIYALQATETCGCASALLLLGLQSSINWDRAGPLEQRQALKLFVSQHRFGRCVASCPDLRLDNS